MANRASDNNNSKLIPRQIPAKTATARLQTLRGASRARRRSKANIEGTDSKHRDRANQQTWLFLQKQPAPINLQYALVKDSKDQHQKKPTAAPWFLERQKPAPRLCLIFCLKLKLGLRKRPQLWRYHQSNRPKPPPLHQNMPTPPKLRQLFLRFSLHYKPAQSPRL